MIEKQAIWLCSTAIFFIAAVCPKPIVIRQLGKHPCKGLARLCFAALGVLSLWGWYLERF